MVASIYISTNGVLLLLLLSRFSHVRLCATLDGSPPGSPIPGILRQEHWSGLPFPSPMHESEKWKWSRSVVSDSQRPQGLQPTRLLHPWDFPARVLEWGAIAFSEQCTRVPLFLHLHQILLSVDILLVAIVLLSPSSYCLLHDRPVNQETSR